MSMVLPLVLRLALAWVAGLLAGFSPADTPLLVGAAASCALLLARFGASRAHPWLALVALAAALVAREHRARERGCLHRLAAGSEWVVRAGEPLAAGAAPRARARVGGCDIPVRIAATRGRARAGSWALVRGRATETPRSLVITDAAVRELRAPGPLARWRAAASVRIGNTFGGDAPLARALLVAEMRDLSPELRDRWSAAGLVHMLSISGTHVAIIAAALELLLRALRLPMLAARLSTLCAISFYVLALGAPPPAVRAAAMLGVVVVTRMLDRPTSPWAPLALGALLPLADPATALDVGWQLSISGVASLICAAALARRLPRRWRRGWRGHLAVGLAGSSLASIASAPLVAWHIGRVSLVGPLANLVAAPLIALAQPALFLGLVVSGWEPIARIVAAGTHPLLVALDLVATAGASVPHAALELSPSATGAVVAGAGALAVLCAAAMRDPLRPVLLALTSLALLAWKPLVPWGEPDARTEVHLMDVGQGDAIGIRTARGHWILVDAGPAWRGGDAGRSVVVPYVRRRGGDVAAVVLTHPHTDHVGGLPTVLRRLHPRLFVDAAYPGSAERYQASLHGARDAGVPWRRAHPGDSIVVDEVTLTVLAPDSAWAMALPDPNDASTVVLARVGRVRFLLTGDAEKGEEGWLLAKSAGLLRAEVLKVGHHGSSTSSTPEFLDAVRPALALVSVGAGNHYRHPDPEVLHALAARGVLTLRTDHLGSVVLRTDGRQLDITADGDRWPCSLDSSPP